MGQWDGVEWERASKTLYVVAACVCGGSSCSIEVGVTADDLVQETLAAFFDSSNGLGWNPGKAPLEKFLAGVLRNKARDHRKRQRKVQGSLDDPVLAHPEPQCAPEIDRDMLHRQRMRDLMEAVAPDKELQDLLAAAELTSGAGNVNQELADALGVTVAEVVNRKRRLMRHPKVREILNEYRQTHG